MVLRDQLRQNGGAHQADIGDPQFPAVFPGGFLRHFHGLERAFKSLARTRHQGMSCCGQRDLVIRSLKKPGPDFRFKIDDLFAKRRVADPQGLGGFSKTLVFCDG
jgi:hypothetical protein